MVLYGLLSGSRPYATESRTPASRSAARTGAPARPLWALPGAPGEAERIAEQRASNVKALRRALRGDLAVVVGKAIKPDAADRYRAMPDFADDLQRVLDRRPIAARPDSLGYRLRRYLQRHAIGVTATALVLLAVTAGVTGTLVKQREAEREARRAVAVKRFLLDLFEQARSSVMAGGTQAREATVNDMLAAGTKGVDKAFGQQPEIRDEIFQILVELYSDTGEPKQIVDLARRRLAAAQAGFGPEDPRVAPAEAMLAGVLLNFGEAPEASKLLAHAQALLDRAGDRSSIERARLLRWQGFEALVTGARPPWADHPLRRATALLRTHYSDDDELLAALAMLPGVACRYGESEEAMAAAEELYRRTLARYGADNLYVDEANMTRGQLLLKGGHAVEALPALQQALEGMRRHVGEKSPNVVVAHLDVAEALLALGRADDSQREFETARSAIERDHADDKRLPKVLDDARTSLERIRAGHPPTCRN
jgi:tetratricopeptide (TPR) repeat protein